MKCKRLLFLLLFLSFLCLTGCWDSAELQDLSIISGIGIDKGGNDEENRYRTTVQIINPPQVAGGQQGGQVQASPVTTFSTTGGTLLEAFRKISNQTPAQLFFPHIEIMIIGEDLAKEGIKELFDLIERDAEFRVLFPVLIAKDSKAEDVFKVMTSLDAIPSAEIVRSLETSSREWGAYSSMRADQVIGKLKSGSLGITGIQIHGDVDKGNKNSSIQQISPDTVLEIRGVALFKDSKLKKWINHDAARGMTWIKNEMKKTVVSLDCKEIKDGMAVELLRSKSDIKVDIKNEKPMIEIIVRTEGVVLESTCPIELDKNDVITKLEDQLKKEIAEEVMAAVKVAQEEKSDIFDFSEYVNIKDKNYWKKIKDKWEDEIFPETEINVTVHASIRRTGMRTKSYIR